MDTLEFSSIQAEQKGHMVSNCEIVKFLKFVVVGRANFFVSKFNLHGISRQFLFKVVFSQVFWFKVSYLL